jgi:predicted lipid-binding transport protein (Tim44 family)
MLIQSRIALFHQRMAGRGAQRTMAFLGRRIGAVAMAGFLAVSSLASFEADARRMGGGRSIGKQSQLAQPSRPPAQQPMQSAPGTPSQANQAAPTPAPGAAAAQPRRNWMGPLAGIAAGLGIAALLSHFGLGGAFASLMSNVILIALVAFAAVWLFRRFARRRETGAAASRGMFEPQTSPSTRQYDMRGDAQPSFGGRETGATTGAPAASAADATPQGSTVPAVPAGFDTQAFVRQAKVSFVRLQAAWDAGNLDDIREFTTPEMFAEIKLDLDARGAALNQTDVVQLEAELLGVEDRGDVYAASVRFHGLMREAQGAAAEPFDEAWNLTRNARRGEGWVLAGIQQLH